MFEHATREFQRAYPGMAQYDAFGKMKRPLPSILPHQVQPFDPDDVLPRRETAKLKPLQKAVQSVTAAVASAQGEDGEYDAGKLKNTLLREAYTTANEAIGKQAGKWARKQGAGTVLTALTEKAAPMVIGQIPSLIGSATSAIGSLFDGGGTVTPGVHAEPPGKLAKPQKNNIITMAAEEFKGASYPSQKMKTYLSTRTGDDVVVGSSMRDAASGPTWAMQHDDQVVADIANMNDPDHYISQTQEIPGLREALLKSEQRKMADARVRSDDLLVKTATMKHQAERHTEMFNQISRKSTDAEYFDMLQRARKMKAETPEMYNEMDYDIRSEIDAALEAVPYDPRQKSDYTPEMVKRDLKYARQQGQDAKKMVYYWHGMAQAPFEMAEGIANFFSDSDDKTDFQQKYREAVPLDQKSAFDMGKASGKDLVTDAIVPGLGRFKLKIGVPSRKVGDIEVDGGDVSTFFSTQSALHDKGFSGSVAAAGGLLAVAAENYGKKGMDVVFQDMGGFLRSYGVDPQAITPQELQQVYDIVINGQIGDAVQWGVEQVPARER